MPRKKKEKEVALLHESPVLPFVEVSIEQAGTTFELPQKRKGIYTQFIKQRPSNVLFLYDF